VALARILAGVAGLLAALAWASPVESSTHTIKIFSTPGPPDRLSDVYLLGTIIQLLRVPPEDRTTSPFWDLDNHPFR
jgi:hypothetical protein